MNNDFRPAAKRTRSGIRTSSNFMPKPQPSTDSFTTPEEAAATDTLHETPQLPSNEDTPATVVTSTNAQLSLRQKLASHWPPSKRLLIIGSIVIVLLIGGTTTWALTRNTRPVVATKAPTKAKLIPKPAVPTVVASTLSGLPVPPSTNSRPVTGVMIENSTFARPQSGLSQASVVFEALAEGGVTRFLALFQDQLPSNVGPVRSLRPYYLSWDLGFDAPIAHVGGSPEALSDVTAWNAPNLDEFANGSSYHRITTRDAPHNVYTSLATLNQLEASKGYTSSTFTGFPRKAAAPLKTPTARTINITLSSSTYNASYAYDSTSNSYNRSEGGAIQTDANTGAQISPQVVIVIVVPYAQGALDASGAYYSDYSVTGTGTAYVFQDGGVSIGTWSKSSNISQITFLNAAGKAIPLNPGQTWITAVTATSDVSYTP